jgi:nucleoside-diphosphate-sugar epimerase/O-antigen/teichoic acid export membrane protein
MESRKKIAKNSVLYLMAMIIPKAAGFFVLPIYTRYISPEDYGIYYLTGSIIGVMAVLSSMGLNAFYLRNYEMEEDKKELNGTIFWSMALWNAVLFILALIVVPIIIKTIKVSFPFYPYMFFSLLTQLFNSMEIIPMRTYRIRGEVNHYFYRILMKTVLSISLGLYFVIGLNLGIIGRYYAELINAFVFAIIFIFYMSKNSYFRIDIGLLKRGVKFSLPIVPSDFVQMSTPMLINLIIEKTLSLTQLGVYSVGVTLSGVIELAQQSIFLSIEPVLYTKAASKDYPQFFKKLKNMTIVTVGIVCVGAGLFVREAAMLLLSDKYWNSWPVVQVISVSYIVSVLKNMYSQLIIVEGRTKYLFWGNIGYLIVGVVVSIFAIPKWGEKALGWSYIFGLLASFFILYALVDKKKYHDMNLFRDFIMIAFALQTLYLSRVLHSNPIVLCILMKMIIYITYILIILIMYNINPKQVMDEFIIKVNKFIASRIARIKEKGGKTKMKKILVTGGAGYIGSVLVRKLLAKGYKVRVVDSLKFGGESIIDLLGNPEFEFVKGDIRDRDIAYETSKDVYAVVHLSAIVGDPACAQSPLEAREVNYYASVQLYEEALKNNVQRFIFSSTCSNYGKMENSEEFLKEDSVLNPLSLYAQTKVEFESYLFSQDKMNICKPVILRFSTVYGLSPRVRFDLTVNEFTKELAMGRELWVFGEQFWRPYCHVDDLANSILTVLGSDESKVAFEVFNVGSTDENYQKKMIIDEILKQIPYGNVKYVSKKEDPRNYRVNFDKITDVLDFKITKRVPDGIKEIIDIVQQGFILNPDEDKYYNINRK